MSRRALAASLVLGLTLGCGSFKRWSYEGFGRDGWQHPEEVLRALEIRPGDAVADLGAGGGYFTFRLADAVGAAGTVYAVDVDPEMVSYLEERAQKEARANVTPVLGRYEDPLLPEAGVGLIFTCNTYHHLQDRTAYFRRVRRSLRPGGRVAIIDYDGTGWFQKIFDHSTPRDVIHSEMQAAGYRLEKGHDFLDRQHFLVFSVEPG